MCDETLVWKVDGTREHLRTVVTMVAASSRKEDLRPVINGLLKQLSAEQLRECLKDAASRISRLEHTIALMMDATDSARPPTTAKPRSSQKGKPGPVNLEN